MHALMAQFEHASDFSHGHSRVIQVGRDLCLMGACLHGQVVGAVAFFAAWSVLSNIFCALLILTTRPFRLYDYIEVLENGDKPGLRGRVIDINFVYTTLQETHANGDDTVLQVPNSQFFQRSTRRWRQEPQWSRVAREQAAHGADWEDAAAR